MEYVTYRSDYNQSAPSLLPQRKGVLTVVHKLTKRSNVCSLVTVFSLSSIFLSIVINLCEGWGQHSDLLAVAFIIEFVYITMINIY